MKDYLSTAFMSSIKFFCENSQAVIARLCRCSGKNNERSAHIFSGFLCPFYFFINMCFWSFYFAIMLCLQTVKVGRCCYDNTRIHTKKSLEFGGKTNILTVDNTTLFLRHYTTLALGKIGIKVKKYAAIKCIKQFLFYTYT